MSYKRCSCCGSSVMPMIITVDDRYVKAVCRLCNHSVMADSKAELIRKWNEREGEEK